MNILNLKRGDWITEGDKDEADEILAAAIQNMQRWRRFAKSHPDLYLNGAIGTAAQIVEYFGDPRTNKINPPRVCAEINRRVAETQAMMEAEGQTKQ